MGGINMKAKYIINEPYVICILPDRKLGKRFKGIAHCFEPDTFDVEFGKERARKKAELKRKEYKYRQAVKMYSWITNYLEKQQAYYLKRMDILDDEIMAQALELNH
jgi:hypothetical protein